jgi:hypothetical protein
MLLDHKIKEAILSAIWKYPYGITIESLIKYMDYRYKLVMPETEITEYLKQLEKDNKVRKNENLWIAV